MYTSRIHRLTAEGAGARSLATCLAIGWLTCALGCRKAAVDPDAGDPPNQSLVPPRIQAHGDSFLGDGERGRFIDWLGFEEVTHTVRLLEGPDCGDFVDVPTQLSAIDD
jgi:hypothetical protein